MQHAMLDPICSGIATTPIEILTYVNSFLVASSGDPTTNQKVKDALKALDTHQGPDSTEDRRLLFWSAEKQKYVATLFGKAAMHSGLAPALAMKVMRDLVRARGTFVMDSELYSCFLCVPVYTEFYMNPSHWAHLWQILLNIQDLKRNRVPRNNRQDTQDDVEEPADWKAAVNLGLFKVLGYIEGKARTSTSRSKAPTTDKAKRIENICRKFYIACMLQQLVSGERTKEDVALEFHIDTANFIGTLQKNTAMFAKKCRDFCKTVRWHQLAAVLDEFGSRIRHGANVEILALSRIKGVSTITARLLFQAELRDIEAVAGADQKTIMVALAKGNTYAHLSKEEAKQKLRKKAGDIWEAAKKILNGQEALKTTQDIEADNLMESGKAVKVVSSRVMALIKQQFEKDKAARERAEAAAEAAAVEKKRQKKEKAKEPEKQQPEKPIDGGHSEEWEAMAAVSRRPAAPPAAPPLAAGAAAASTAAAAPGAAAAPLAAGAAAASAAAGAPGASGAGPSKAAAGSGNGNAQTRGTQQTVQPPRPPAPAKQNTGGSGGGGDDSVNGNGGDDAPGSGSKGDVQKQRPKKDDRNLFLINTNERLDRFIRNTLSKQTIFGAQFIIIPRKKAYTNDPLAHTKAIAAMAPPIKLKKKAGDKDKKKATTLYDDDLDGDDPKAKKNAGPPGPPPGTVIGLALSWGPGVAAYIPLYGPAFNGDLNLAAQKLADVILASEVEIAWFGWRKQVEATRWLFSHASNSNDGTSADDKDKKVVSRTGVDIHRFMTDSRIATWMCNPGVGYVQDGIFTEGDLNSNLLPSDGKRKRGDEQVVCGAEMVLTTFLKGNSTVADRVVGPLRSDDAEKPVGVHALRACQTAAVALQLRNAAIKYFETLGDPALLDAFRRYEMPLVPVLADMERAGAGFSIEKLNKMLPRMKRRLAELQTLAHAAAGDPFQLTAPAQVADVLYRRLRLPPPHGCGTEKINKKDGSKYMSYSTSSNFLEMIKDVHPIVPMIMEHRKLVHTVERVGDMLKLARAEKELLVANGGGDGTSRTRVVAVHCPFMQLGTATGRLAMEGFNLQNLTKPYPFKALPTQPQQGGAGGAAAGAGGAGTSRAAGAETMLAGSEELELTQEGGHMQLEANMRSAIVPAKPGRVILAADFRQIEFRMMAHFSKDPVVREMLADGAEDPFKLVAARWRKLPVDQVTSKIRDDAKQIIYALFYGMGANSMADRLGGVSPKDAQKMKEEFLETYSGIKNWIEQVKVDAAGCGYITSLSGRRRWIPDIQSTDKNLKSFGERQAVNSICQGSAADVAKKAMIDICREFEVHNLRDHVDMVLQIHDELVFEVDLEYQNQVAKIVKECMENVAKLEIPLRAKLECGASWGEMQRLEI
jgi:DNA polymerase I-like protein with 3'-5' exonuclease and polymerase domains